MDFNPGNVHRTLAALVDAGFVERDDDAYVVPDPGSLLEAWADQAPRPREQYALPIQRSPLEDAKRLASELGIPVVVSGELGAELLAPYLSSESAVIHLHEENVFHALASSAFGSSLPSVARHGRLLFDLTDPGTDQFAAHVQGLRVAHPVQIYVDLYRERGRAREAGEHLRQELIRF